MINLARRTAPVMFGVLLMVGVSGCGGSEKDTEPPQRPLPSIDPSKLVPSATPTGAVTGRTYTLPASLCGATDFSPLQDLYPKRDPKPLSDSSGYCATSLTSDTTWVSFSVDSELAPNPKMGQAYLDTGRRILKSPTTKVDGVGADAYVTVNGNDHKLVTYDGNLILEFTISAGKKQYPLPPDITERLGKVANGTFAKLAK